MPKKMIHREPAVFFEQLLEETLASADPTEPTFSVMTPDPAYKSFATELVDQHYPSQIELPLA